MTQWNAALQSHGRAVLVEDALDKSSWCRCDDSHSGTSGHTAIPGGCPFREPAVPTATLLRECPAHFYRASIDVAPDFLSVVFNANYLIALLTPYLHDPAMAPRPGCWAYADMLEVGVENSGHALSLVEQRTHFALWCVLSSPLILGFDLANETVYRQMYPIVANPSALNVSAAWAGSSGRLVQNSSQAFAAPVVWGATGGGHLGVVQFATWQIWSKPVGGGTWAVLLVAVGDDAVDVPLRYDVISEELGDAVIAHDVWSGEEVHTATGGVTTFRGIAPHDSVFLLLQPAQ